MGALAQIEDALGGDISSLQERLKNPRIRDVLLILHALLGGGGARLSLEVLSAAQLDLGVVSGAIVDVFSQLNDGAESDAE